MVIKFKTLDFSGYSVRFSPHLPDRLACVSSQNYGISGSGALFVLDVLADQFGQRLDCRRLLMSNGDPLYDLCWSESQANLLWTVSANGFIHVWDLTDTRDQPIHVMRGHEREIYSIHMSPNGPNPPNALTTSSDSTVKIWDVLSTQFLGAFIGHQNIVYCGQWSPLIPHTFATVSGDSTLKVWSLQQSKPVIDIMCRSAEVLSCDWNKFSDHLITTSDTNGVIHVWDVRAPVNPMHTLTGHSKAIKCVKFSPHRQSVIGSTSYDMTTRLWDINTNDGLLFTSQQHSEFVFSMDFNRHIEDQIADCSWDQFVHIFSYSPQFVNINHL